MILQVGVKVILKNKDNKYLLLKRSKRYPDAQFKWDIAGGRINTGSSLMDNLKREVKEETNLDLEKPVKLIAAQDILKSDKHIVRLTYLGEIEGEPKISDEHTDFRWFTKEEMESLKPEEIDKYLKGILNAGLIS